MINNNTNYIEHIKSVRKKLLHSSELFELFQKNDKESLKSLIRIILQYIFFIIIFPYFFNFNHNIGFLLGIVFLGTSAYKFQFIIHESAHANLFTNRKLNDVVGNVFSYLFGMSISSYRNFHFEHHNKTNTYEDPQFQDSLGDKNKNLSKKNYFLFIVAPLYFEKFLNFIKREIFLSLKYIFDKKVTHNNEKDNFKKKIDFYSIIFSLIINLSIPLYFFLKTQSYFAAICYHLSLFTFTLFLARIRTLAEHQHSENSETPYEFTRSHQKNFIDSFFFSDLNFCYHLEHHIYPRMPFYNLEKFNKKYYKIIHGQNNTFGRSMLSTIYNRFKKAN
jgi:fatty acid desaturase